MNYYRLTPYLQRRFRNSRKCVACGELISNTDELYYEQSYYGRFKIYRFWHRRCVKNVKEKATS